MEPNKMCAEFLQYGNIYKHISDNIPQGYAIKTDSIQNIIVYNTESDNNNTLVLFNADMPYLIITDVHEKEKSADFELIGYKELLSNQFVLKNGDRIGIIRDKKDDKTKQYIEIISKSDINKGDILTLESIYLCKDNILYTNTTSKDFAEYYYDFLSKNLLNSVKLSHFTVAFSEKTALTFLNKQKFDKIILLDWVNADDDISDFKFNNGAGLIMKGGGYVLRNCFYEKVKDLFGDKKEFSLCFCKSAAFAEKLEILYGVPVYSIGVPIKFKDGNLSEISIDDIESASKLTVEILNRI